MALRVSYHLFASTELPYGFENVLKLVDVLVPDTVVFFFMIGINPLQLNHNQILKAVVMFLSFRTDRSGQTVQTQIRGLLIRVYTVCHFICIVWTHYSMVEPHSSTFRVMTTNFLGVRIFRKFTVTEIPSS